MESLEDVLRKRSETENKADWFEVLLIVIFVVSIALVLLAGVYFLN